MLGSLFCRPSCSSSIHETLLWQCCLWPFPFSVDYWWFSFSSRFVHKIIYIKHPKAVNLENMCPKQKLQNSKSLSSNPKAEQFQISFRWRRRLPTLRLFVCWFLMIIRTWFSAQKRPKRCLMMSQGKKTAIKSLQIQRMRLWKLHVRSCWSWGCSWNWWHGKRWLQNSLGFWSYFCCLVLT